jgi:ribosome-associated protein
MIEDLVVGYGVRLPARALDVRFSRSGGPGGQNVNKVETKATVRLDVARAAEIPEWARALLLEKLASRLTNAGELVVSSERHRDRARNLAAARERLAELLREALAPRTPRKETRPTRGSKERRLETKRKRSGSKQARRGPGRAGRDEEW